MPPDPSRYITPSFEKIFRHSRMILHDDSNRLSDLEIILSLTRKARSIPEDRKHLFTQFHQSHLLSNLLGAIDIESRVVADLGSSHPYWKKFTRFADHVLSILSLWLTRDPSARYEFIVTFRGFNRMDNGSFWKAVTKCDQCSYIFMNLVRAFFDGERLVFYYPSCFQDFKLVISVMARSVVNFTTNSTLLSKFYSTVLALEFRSEAERHYTECGLRYALNGIWTGAMKRASEMDPVRHVHITLVKRQTRRIKNIKDEIKSLQGVAKYLDGGGIECLSVLYSEDEDEDKDESGSENENENENENVSPTGENQGTVKRAKTI